MAAAWGRGGRKRGSGAPASEPQHCANAAQHWHQYTPSRLHAPSVGVAWGNRCTQRLMRPGTHLLARCAAQVVNFAFLEDPAEAFPHVTWAKLDRLGYALELWQGVDWVVELGGAADEAAGMPGEPGARARSAVL